MKQDHTGARPAADRPTGTNALGGGSTGSAGHGRRALRVLAEAAIALALLALAALGAREILAGRPDAERREVARTARLVTVERVEAATAGPVVEAWGIVEAERALSLAPQVGGRVVWVSPALAPGGTVAEGDPLVRLDPTPFEIALAEAEASVAEIAARIRIEAGQQDRARRDLERSPLRQGVTEEQRALILREPQRAELEAQRAAAEARRDAARLDLARATLTAPFDALVEAEDAATGAILMQDEEAARLVATDRFRVVLAVPPAALDVLDLAPGTEIALDQPGVWPEAAVRTARIERIAPGLTGQGRMAEVIAAVDDPLARDPATGPAHRLLIGSFLRARLPGRPIPGAVALDRAWLRDGGTVWVMTEDGRLEIRRPEIAWRGAREVLVTGGLTPGERVVTTALATVADGMALRTAEAGGTE